MPAKALAKNVQDKKFNATEVTTKGDKIILPVGMSYAKAIEWLKRREVEEEREVAINEPVDCYPLDGANALMLALKEKFGWAEAVPRPSFFGQNPPLMIGVEVAPGKTTQVIWGRMQIPNIHGFLETGYFKRDGRFIFAINGITKQKHKAEIAAIADLTRKIAREHSIYRGKAIKVNLAEEDAEDFDPRENAPKFIDTSRVNENAVVFSKSVMEQVIDSIFVPIELSEQCRQLNVPLKRGVLLAGPYGVGKSLCSLITAKKCVNSGWTFIYVNKRLEGNALATMDAMLSQQADLDLGVMPRRIG